MKKTNEQNINITESEIEKDTFTPESLLEEANRRPAKYTLGGVKYPVIMLRGLVIFPHNHVKFDVSRPKSIAALTAAQQSNSKIIVVAQKDPSASDPTFDELFTVGTLCTIENISKENDSMYRVLVSGEKRQKINKFVLKKNYVEAFATDVIEQTNNPIVEETCLRVIMHMMVEYVKLAPQMPQDMIPIFADTDNPSEFADIIASNIIVKFDDGQSLLEEFVIDKRLDKLANILAKEIELLKVENKIMTEVKQQIDKSQKEYFLREQLKAIERELGDDVDDDDDSGLSPAADYKAKIENSDMPPYAREKALEEAKRLRHMQFGSAEISVIQNYLDWLLCLPWTKESDDNIDLQKARKILDKDHYGLDKVKQRLIEFLAVKAHTGTMKGSIICLVGPPGVGKTSIGRSLARAMKREFVRLSLGGVHDEAEIRGHRKTYIGAMPGKIISSLKNAKTINPLFLLDEIDKLGNDFRGDPASALLEVLDSEQNCTYVDHYIEIPYDLSKIMFIMTANTLDTIPPALLDRMEVIEIPGYTDEEKLNIAKKHLLPKQREMHGLSASQCSISTDVIKYIIDHYTREAGVRALEREIAALCRKAVVELEENKELEKVRFTVDNIPQYLGSPKYLFDEVENENRVGLATGLAWTAVGGETLSIEVAAVPGNGALVLTGHLGDVMKESATAGITHIRSRAHEFGIEDSFFKSNDIHIHVPEGAIPKDGPSAGITITTAVLSRLTGIPVKSTVAMTGEITLLGRVLPIGGLKEKLLAAKRMGIKTVIVPQDNKKDIDEIPVSVTENMQIVFAKTIDDVLSVALDGTPKPKQ